MTSQIVTKCKRRWVELLIHPPTMWVGVEDTQLRSPWKWPHPTIRQAEMWGPRPVLLSPHFSWARS